MACSTTYLVEKQYIPVAHQAHAQLDPPTLTVGYLMHVPVQVDIEDVKEPVPPFLVPVAAYRVEEVGDDNVTAHDWVHSPESEAISGRRSKTTILRALW